MKYWNLEQYCGSFPSGFDFTCEYGEGYTRYRWGYFSIIIDGKTVFRKKVGGEFDGCMDQEQHEKFLKEYKEVKCQSS